MFEVMQALRTPKKDVPDRSCVVELGTSVEE